MARDLKAHVGIAVRAERKRQQMTQEELAAAVGRTPESISNLERGKRLSLNAVAAIAAALEIPVAELFDGYEPRRKGSRERAELEQKLHQAGKNLSPRSLKLAVALLATLAEQDSKP